MAIVFEAVRRMALALPQVTESLGQRGWAFKAKGRLLACQAIHRSAEEDSLVVKVPLEERGGFLKDHPAALYVTPHYAGYPCLLVRLKEIDQETLEGLLERAWQFVLQEPTRGRKRAPRRRDSVQKPGTGTSRSRVPATRRSK